MRTLRLLAFVTAGFAYAIIVLGFVVRITGSGMGCGDHWPLCNGHLIPSFGSAEVAIEYAHRLAVLGLSALMVAMVALAVRLRRAPGGSGPGGTLFPALLAVGLLVLQSVLGAITVWLELPAHTVVLHLGTALALLATLLVLGLRAGVHAGAIAPPGRDGALAGRGGVVAAVVLGGLVVLMGGMTAATGATTSCMGFPLCNGQFWPSGGGSGLPHIHWTHRLLAYALFLHLFGIAIAMRRRSTPARVQAAAWVAFALGVAQVAAGAVMILTTLPPAWRAIHAALGTGVWVGLVWLGWLVAGRAGRQPAGV